MLERIQDGIISTKKEIIQLYGLDRHYTLALLFIANHYVSIGKIVIFLNYSSINVESRAKKHKFKALKKDKFVIISRPSISDFIDNLSNINVDDKDTIIMVNSMDFLYATNTSSYTKISLLHETNIKKLQLFSQKIFFTNSLFHSPYKESISTININVDYKLDVNMFDIEENVEFFKTIKRKSIISNIIDDNND